MEQARADKIRHIMKRITGIIKLLTEEVDALNIEITELLTKEETNGKD